MSQQLDTGVGTLSNCRNPSLYMKLLKLIIDVAHFRILYYLLSIVCLAHKSSSWNQLNHNRAGNQNDSHLPFYSQNSS